MSLHSYSRIWLHLVWSTLNREPLLPPPVATKCAPWLHDYSRSKSVFLKTCYFNAEHVHALVDLPTDRSVEEVTQLFKGASSHWINEQRFVPGRFAWGRGYGVFSVSESLMPEVVAYIDNQAEHHRRRSFAEEIKLFVERHGLKWHEEKAVETAAPSATDLTPG